MGMVLNREILNLVPKILSENGTKFEKIDFSTKKFG